MTENDAFSLKQKSALRSKRVNPWAAMWGVHLDHMLVSLFSEIDADSADGLLNGRLKIRQRHFVCPLRLVRYHMGHIAIAGDTILDKREPACIPCFQS